MTRRHRFLALAVTVFLLPLSANAQSGYGGMAPPIPSGPPLAPVPADSRRPTWVEDGPAVVPAAGWGAAPAGAVGVDSAWPVAQSASACNFDDPELNGLPAMPTSVQILQGGYFSSSVGPTVPAFNYLPLTIRHGWTLGQPFGWQHSAPGYWEVLVDVTGAAITSSYGNWIAGSSALLRYNWADQGSPFIPYIQAGAGAMLNDAYREEPQRAIGQSLEFILHAQVGLKCFVAPNLSLDIEGGFQHISNAGMASRNSGVNAFGGSLGFTYYFPWGQP